MSSQAQELLYGIVAKEKCAPVDDTDVIQWPKRGRARSEKPILGFRQIKLLFTEINDNILVVHKVIWSSANVFEVIANLEKPSKRSAASETGRRSTRKKFSYKQSQSRQKAREIFVNKN